MGYVGEANLNYKINRMDNNIEPVKENWLKRNLLFILLAENVLAHTQGAFAILFYIIIIVGALFLFSDTLFNPDTYKSCKGIYWIGLIYFIYEFSFGIRSIDRHNLLYLAAKLSTFIIIITCVTSNWEFYFKKNIWLISFLLVGVVVYGILFGGGKEVNGRLLLGFTNSNDTSIFSAIAFAGFFYYSRSLKPWIFIVLAICIYGVLAGASRNGMVILVLYIFLRSGISFKTIFVGALICLFSLVILPSANIQTQGIERLTNTISGKESSDRDEVRRAAWKMIEQRPIEGWGYDATNTGAAAIISKMGAHNGYLDNLKFMGYPCFVLWIITMLIFTIPLLRLYRINDRFVKFHVAVLITTYFSAFFESYFVGVHEFVTNFFFTSMALLSTYKYREGIE